MPKKQPPSIAIDANGQAWETGLDPTPLHPDWITVVKAAEILGVTAGRVQQLVVAKRLTATPVNPRLNLLSCAEVLRFKRRKRPGGRPRKNPVAK
jgi:hypothetical protein